jgi:hypothetical protein
MGHGVMVYHLDPHYQHKELSVPPPRTRVRPILFLSRTLTKAEISYWPTELEVSCLVWTLRKIRPLIESASKVVIYTDHASTVGISKQTSLNLVALENLNLQLICASQYIQQFRLSVYHKPGRTNIVPDALS